MKRIIKAFLIKMFRPILFGYHNILSRLENLDRKLDDIIYKLSLVDDIVELKNARFFVPNAPRDVIQNTQLSRGVFFEEEILQSLDKYLTQDSVVVDIGANVGNHTIYWGKVTKVKKIYSFEPIKATFKILEKNISINNLSEIVKIYNVGLGNKTTKGEKKYYNPNNIGSTAINENSEGDIQLNKIESFQGANGGDDFTYKFLKNLNYEEPIKYAYSNYLYIHMNKT